MIYFTRGFEDDLILVLHEGEILFEGELTTDESLGIAAPVELDLVDSDGLFELVFVVVGHSIETAYLVDLSKGYYYWL